MNINELRPKLSIDASIVRTRDVVPQSVQSVRRVCPWVFISCLGRVKLRPYNYHSVMNIKEVAPKLSFDLTIVNKFICSLFRMKDSNKWVPSAFMQAMWEEIKYKGILSLWGWNTGLFNIFALKEPSVYAFKK